MKCDDETGPSGCAPLALERIRYFTGRQMTARDFQDADAYTRSFRHLHNRVLHGWGIACGLEVVRHARPECRRDRVVVRCGLAIDCCGREIVVAKAVSSPKIPWGDRPKDDDAAVLALCLRYCETLVEKVPVLYNEAACANPSMEYGRVRESYCLEWHWIRREDLPNYGWGTPERCPPADDDAYLKSAGQQHPQEPCPEDDDSKGCCVEPDCPPDHCVLLAVLKVSRCDDFTDRDHIDSRGRRSLITAREHLTHVCGINWVHGGVMKASALKALRVRFDRPLMPPEYPRRPGPRGINERTFVVQYGQQTDDHQMEDLDFVEYRRPPYLLPDRQTAVYEIRKPASYRSHVIHVTLRCDFIVDCRRQPVDGDHLGGDLPSGNGLPGGTFESWFRVVDDDDYDAVVKATESSDQPDAQEY
jgi:hypothetical protein